MWHFFFFHSKILQYIVYKIKILLVPCFMHYASLTGFYIVTSKLRNKKSFTVSAKWKPYHQKKRNRAPAWKLKNTKEIGNTYQMVYFNMTRWPQTHQSLAHDSTQTSGKTKSNIYTYTPIQYHSLASMKVTHISVF